MLAEAEATAHLSSLFSLLRTAGTSNYIGESISQLEHCLQAAASASHASASPSTVLAALLHDVGQFLPAKEGAEVLRNAEGEDVGRKGHEAIGEEWLKQQGWPRDVTELVGAHVVAKRWLTATDPGYLEGLSSASKASLRHQGGPFTPIECAAFEADPLFSQKVQLRRWDDAAKVVGVEDRTPRLEAYWDMGLAVLTRDG